MIGPNSNIIDYFSTIYSTSFNLVKFKLPSGLNKREQIEFGIHTEILYIKYL